MGISEQSFRIVTGLFVSNQIQKKRKHFPAVKKSMFAKIFVYISCLLLLNTIWPEVLNLSQKPDISAVCLCLTKPNQLSSCNIVDKEFNLSQNKCFILGTDVNFNARYVNGNRKNRGLKITHWNLGSAHLENKIHEIETVVADFRPHLLGISESNFFKYQDKEKVMLEDYELITSSTLDNPNLEVSRVVVYKHKSVVAKIRKDLMSDSFSSVWMEVGLPNKKKILMCHFYREHQYLRQTDLSSLTHNEQLSRWLSFLDQWERAISTGKECLVLGDSNIDHLMLGSSELNQYRHKDLLTHLCDRIYPLGVRQCVKSFTHSRSGQRNSLLDVVYSNNTEKISTVTSIPRGESDHNIITVVRHSKSVVINNRYTKKRSYKDFDEDQFCNEVKKISWWSLYNATDVNIAVNIFTKNISEILNSMAPVRVFQTRRKYVPWITQETKSLMSLRDSLLTRANCFELLHSKQIKSQ